MYTNELALVRKKEDKKEQKTSAQNVLYILHTSDVLSLTIVCKKFPTVLIYYNYS